MHDRVGMGPGTPPIQIHPWPSSSKFLPHKISLRPGLFALLVSRCNTTAHAALLAVRHHAGGPDGVVEMVDAGRHPLDEIPAGFGQSDAACMSLEQEDAKVF